MTIDVIETRDFAFLPIVNYGEHGLVMGFMWWRFMPKFGREESMPDFRPKLGREEPFGPKGDKSIDDSLSEPVGGVSQQTVEEITDAFIKPFKETDDMAEKVKERFDVFMDTQSKEMLVSLGLLEAENLLLYAKWKLRSEKYHIIRGFCRKRALKALLDYRYCERGIESISKDLLRHESSN